MNICGVCVWKGDKHIGSSVVSNIKQAIRCRTRVRCDFVRDLVRYGWYLKIKDPQFPLVSNDEMIINHLAGCFFNCDGGHVTFEMFKRNRKNKHDHQEVSL